MITTPSMLAGKCRFCQLAMTHPTSPTTRLDISEGTEPAFAERLQHAEQQVSKDVNKRKGFSHVAGSFQELFKAKLQVERRVRMHTCMGTYRKGPSFQLI